MTVAKLRMAPQQRLGDTTNYQAALRRYLGFSTPQEAARIKRENAAKYGIDSNLPDREFAFAMWEKIKVLAGIRMPALPRQPERTPGEDDE